MKKILIILMLIMSSISSYAALPVIDGAANAKLAQMYTELKKIEQHTNQTMKDQQKEMTEELSRWNNATQTGSFYTQLDDFVDFVNDFRNSTNALQSIYTDTQNVTKSFYTGFDDMFSTSDVITDMTLKQINKKNAQLKSLTENTLKNSNQLLYYMLGDKAKDVQYQITQADILKNLTYAKIQPKEILKGMTQSIIQTNQILLEIKAIQTSMLQQITQLNQEQITQQKLVKEEVLRNTKKSYESMTKKK